MFFKKKKKIEDAFFKNLYKKDRLVRYAQFLFGVAIVAITFNVLILPSKVVYGMNGVSVMINHIFSIDPSLIILIGSLVLLILSRILLGRSKTTLSIVGSLLLPLLIKLTENFGDFIKFENSDPLLLVIMGAVLTGIGLGFVFKSGFSTGGTDILNQIVSKYFKMSMGKAMFFTDGVIVATSVFVFGWTQLMYSIISLYIISMMTDKVMLGISNSKAFYIITKKEDEIKSFITQYLSHGATIIDAKGGYTGKSTKVIMCIIPTKEYFLAKEGIHNIDSEAFFVVTDAYEVFGGE